MKLREVLYLLGRKPAPQRYGYNVGRCHLPQEGAVDLARWLHPRETRKSVHQAEVDELRTFLSRGDVAIDIGAHTGDSTVPMALACGREGTVIALEPNSYVFPVLEANAALNTDRTHIIPLMFAATASDGTFQFEYSDAGFCNGGSHEGVSRWIHGSAFSLPVAGRNLEQVMRSEYSDLLGKLKYIKVDAEGADHAVVASIAGLLRDYRPFLKVEIFKRTTQEQRVAFLGFLHELGYVMHHVDDDGRYRGDLLTAENVMRWRHYDAFGVPAEKAVVSR